MDMFYISIYIYIFIYYRKKGIFSTESSLFKNRWAVYLITFNLKVVNSLKTDCLKIKPFLVHYSLYTKGH